MHLLIKKKSQLDSKFALSYLYRLFYRVPVHRKRNSISPSTDLWVCGKSACSPICEWASTSVNTSCLPHPTYTSKNHLYNVLPKFLDVTLSDFVWTIFKKENDFSIIQIRMLLVAGQSWREGLMICFKFNAFHYQVQVIMTISAFSFYTVVDNGPSAEIHKTVSIFLRG